MFRDDDSYCFIETVVVAVLRWCFGGCRGPSIFAVQILVGVVESSYVFLDTDVSTNRLFLRSPRASLGFYWLAGQRLSDGYETVDECRRYDFP